MKKRAWIGVDPGSDGAAVILLDDGAIFFLDWLDEKTLYYVLQDWHLFYDVRVVIYETVWGRKGNSAKSNTTFQQHVGAIKCILTLLDCNWVFNFTCSKT